MFVLDKYHSADKSVDFDQQAQDMFVTFIAK